ncbi:MAG: hypothetical protein RBR62_04730 [Bacteroidales bacterium]|jgi:hypothetical protein|nr:hypothetical protein [Bacteroidales bacterium]
MKYSEVITEIVQRTDEAFIDVSEERARIYFREAVANLIRQGSFVEGDLLIMSFIKAQAVSGNILLLSDISDKGILLIQNIFPDPEGSDDLIISRASFDEVARWSSSPNLRPSEKTVKWYQVGKTIKFVPGDKLVGKNVEIVFIQSPPIYDNVGTGDYLWKDNTEMLDWFSFPFLNSAIEQARLLLAGETN